MKLVHYSDKLLTLDAVESRESSKIRHDKPCGLWVSVEVEGS